MGTFLSDSASAIQAALKLFIYKVSILRICHKKLSEELFAGRALSLLTQLRSDSAIRPYVLFKQYIYSINCCLIN